MKLTPGVNFTNILRVAFTLGDPKSAKKDNQVMQPFALSGSDEEIDPWCQFHQHFTSSFYARRSQKHKKTVKSCSFLRFQDPLMESTPGVNFTNILQAAFLYRRVLRSFNVLTLLVCIFFAKGNW